MSICGPKGFDIADPRCYNYECLVFVRSFTSVLYQSCRSLSRIRKNVTELVSWIVLRLSCVEEGWYCRGCCNHHSNRLVVCIRCGNNRFGVVDMWLAAVQDAPLPSRSVRGCMPKASKHTRTASRVAISYTKFANLCSEVPQSCGLTIVSPRFCPD